MYFPLCIHHPNMVLMDSVSGQYLIIAGNICMYDGWKQQVAVLYAIYLLFGFISLLVVMAHVLYLLV